jgi:hypothetical protein
MNVFMSLSVGSFNLHVIERDRHLTRKFHVGSDLPDKKRSIQIRVIGFELVPLCGWKGDKQLIEVIGSQVL